MVKDKAMMALEDKKESEWPLQKIKIEKSNCMMTINLESRNK